MLAQAGAGGDQVEDLDHLGAQAAGEAGLAAHRVLAGHPALLVGGGAQGQVGEAEEAVMGDHAVPGRVDVGQAGAHVLVHRDGAPCPGLGAGRDQQVGVGADPDRDQDQVHLALVGLAVAAGAVHLEAAGRRRRGPG